MLKPRILSLGLVLALGAPAVCAATAGPTGIWDLAVRSIVAVRFPKDPVASSSALGQSYKLVQFRSDGGYTGLPWLNVPGQWRASLNGKRFRVSFDAARIDAGETAPPFLEILSRQYAEIVNNKYGANAASAAPKIEGYEVRGFADSGRYGEKKTKKKGLQYALTGGGKIRLAAFYTDPRTQQRKSFPIVLFFAYKGERASAPSECCSSDDAAQNLADSQAFLAANARLPGYKTTASGLQYRVLNAGDGAAIGPDSTVSVSYLQYLPSGFVLARGTADLVPTSLIQGLAEALPLMRVGSYYRFVIPPDLAYGEAGRPPYIKPDSAVIFDISVSAVR